MAHPTEPMTPARAHIAYGALVEAAGALENGREDFVAYQTRVAQHEHRFNGRLGWGGKFRREVFRTEEVWRVDYYPEDKTPERDVVQAVTNTLLHHLARALHDLEAR